MTLRLPDHWVWDSWLADDGELFHLFFLRASRALHDPHRRHGRANVGHATSRDLKNWTVRADALTTSDSPAFDDRATWTGSVIKDPSGGWRMFYTGNSLQDPGFVQRIGVATSDDLTTWHKSEANPISQADSRWYETDKSEVAWRDPWVYEHEGVWHMLVTARDKDGGGVIGHLTSDNLDNWEAQPPLTKPAEFFHLEVPQVAVVDGQPLLVFSCQPGGTWVIPGDSLIGPFDITKAKSFDHHSLYAARLVQDREGRWNLLGFLDTDPDGTFRGEVGDPIAVRYDADLGLTRSPDVLYG